VKVNPLLADKVKRFGGFDVSACYNCGNCTAICPLVKEEYEFPRKLIRFTLLGLEDKALSLLELWLCYHCGECTDTCPRSADPGEFMMALRRYAIQKYSWGGVAKAFYSKTALTIVLSVFTVFVAAMLFLFHGPMNMEYVDIYSFIGYDLIHLAGIVAGVFIGLSALANLLIMYFKFIRNHVRTSVKLSVFRQIGLWIWSLILTVVREMLAQKKYFECKNKHRYVAHMFLFWGFVGLFIATSIHYVGDLAGIHVDWIYPRILGIAAGVLLMYGTSYFMYKRLEKKENFTTYSHLSDWLFLILMFLTGLTGFLITIFAVLNLPLATYVMYGLHLLVLFDLLITAPFTKFAHAVYRPLAIWVSEFFDHAK
jgi:nitrate reductase gamma subunit/NAD-dependent dihydropyrimidine dehydrogenase PreA subunit